jgi:hypothetical protein
VHQRCGTIMPADDGEVPNLRYWRKGRIDHKRVKTGNGSIHGLSQNTYPQYYTSPPNVSQAWAGSEPHSVFRMGGKTMKLEAGPVSHPRIRPFSNFHSYLRLPFRVCTCINSDRASKTSSCRLLSFAALKVNREELTTEFIANRINVPTFVVQ